MTNETSLRKELGYQLLGGSYLMGSLAKDSSDKQQLEWNTLSLKICNAHRSPIFCSLVIFLTATVKIWLVIAYIITSLWHKNCINPQDTKTLAVSLKRTSFSKY